MCVGGVLEAAVVVKCIAQSTLTPVKHCDVKNVDRSVSAGQRELKASGSEENDTRKERRQQPWFLGQQVCESYSCVFGRFVCVFFTRGRH